MSNINIQLPSATLMNVLDSTAKTLKHAELTTNFIYELEFGNLNDLTLDNYKLLFSLSCFLNKIMNSYINNAANFQTAVSVIDNQLDQYIEKCNFDPKLKHAIEFYKRQNQIYKS